MQMTTLFGAAGTLVGLVRAVPQLIRILRARDAHGVSVDTAATSAIVSSGWATYGVLTSQPAVTFATGASAVVFVAITIFSLRYGRSAREFRAAPIWFVVLASAVALAGSRGLGVLLPVSVLIANLPQVVIAFREADLSALSPATWMLSVADGVVWLGYSLAGGDGSILLFGMLQTTTSGVIVARRWAWQMRGGRMLESDA
ncbi:MAG: hypothetical protein ACRDKT_00885 [Actinomycetota bacterium]